MHYVGNFYPRTVEHQLTRMPIQKLNFGSGNPVFIFPLTIGRNSAAILADKYNFLLRLVY